MSEHNIYVQDINYPTVSYGEECLRVVPTPLHMGEIKMHFVNSLGIIWQQLDLPFMKPVEACSKFFWDDCPLAIPNLVPACICYSLNFNNIVLLYYNLISTVDYYIFIVILCYSNYKQMHAL